jgi:hypothetical protein
VGTGQHMRLPGAAIDRTEEPLRAVVVGRVHQPGDADKVASRRLPCSSGGITAPPTAAQVSWR